MNFRKLFKLLVVSGAMIGTGSGCAASAAQGAQSSDKKTSDGGVASAPTTPDAGQAGGVQGW
jgi:hypothetical protein